LFLTNLKAYLPVTFLFCPKCKHINNL